MLTLTREAARAIRELTADEPDGAGVRLYGRARRFARDEAPAIEVELAGSPDVEDTVLEAEGARLYLDEDSFRELEDKLLDAQVEGEDTRFLIFRQSDAARAWRE